MSSFFTILIISLPLLSGCAGYRLYGERSFAEEMNQEDSFFISGRDFPFSEGDRGRTHRNAEQIAARTPASLKEAAQAKEQSRLTAELMKRESRLSGAELKKYNGIKRELGTLSEKIYYLQLSPAERGEYINMRIPHERRPQFKSENPHYKQDISLNMTKEDVVHRWGRPSLIEIAGEPVRQNERWIFIRLSGRRTLYFEEGRVRGWTILD